MIFIPVMVSYCIVIVYGDGGDSYQIPRLSASSSIRIQSSSLMGLESNSLTNGASCLGLAGQAFNENPDLIKALVDLVLHEFLQNLALSPPPSISPLPT